MSEDKFVRLELRDAVALLTLHRPGKANAYHTPLLEQLEAAIEQAEQDPAIRVLVLTGAGRTFCAGADLAELRARTAETGLDLKSASLFSRLSRLPKVTLAALNGPAVAGGLELALACDLRVACEEAYFALPEVSLGIIPAAGGTRRLPRLIGPARAKAMILGGKQLSAAEGLACGLVSELVPRERVVDHTLEWAARIARQNPMALRLAKQAIDFEAEQAYERIEALSQALLYELAHRP